MKELCPGKGHISRDLTRKEQPLDRYHSYWPHSFLAENPYQFVGKRPRLRCELCGRSVKTSARISHEGDRVIFSIGPHKPKGWYKKSKK